MIIQEILTAPSDNPRDELDAILAQCCELVIDNQERDPENFGWVGACVVGTEGQQVYRTSYKKDNGKWVHAEVAALEAYGDVTPECIVVTTLSPCNRPMEDRAGESCKDVIESYGIEHVYCGYKDPTQDQDDSIETDNPKLKKLCKRLADTFLKEAVDPISGAGKDVVVTPPKLQKQPPVKPINPAVKLDIKQQEKNLYDQTYKKPVKENFHDGRVKGKSRPGRVKRAGASCKGSVTSLRAKAKKTSGERARMYHWCANMKGGKKNEDALDEKWSKKYKRSIDCSHPKGFSQRAHCQGRKKK